MLEHLQGFARPSISTHNTKLVYKNITEIADHCTYDITSSYRAEAKPRLLALPLRVCAQRDPLRSISFHCCKGRAPFMPLQSSGLAPMCPWYAE